ncbi:MAG: NAD+ synthase [Immundisolibacteraceae bacterium]|nr:NAD+ synthase [Immundisolibacteraceae bacterium]
MGRKLTVAIAQMNCVVGDIQGNVTEVAKLAEQARDEFNADLMVCPELTLSGYPPEDLLHRPEFLQQMDDALRTLQRSITGIHLIVGHPQRYQQALYNAASIIGGGKIIGTYYKQLLPNYSVFDEKRYFTAGTDPLVVPVNGFKLGITICEDIWQPEPSRATANAGAEMIINLNASPFHVGKQQEREIVAGHRARENNLPIVYVNMAGGQDELVFDAASCVINRNGECVSRFPAFASGLFITEFDKASDQAEPVGGTLEPVLSVEASIYQALVCGVRDYVEKNHFEGVLIGLSGGVDSALTLAIAVDALGADRVEAVMMPSEFTADISLNDADEQAKLMGVHYREIPIKHMVTAVETALDPVFNGLERDATEENIQARIRGLLLMAMSNKSGRIVLTTGNKSEMAVGYATLYGDMAGGFAAIKDVPKQLVYRLCNYRNQIERVIPQRVLDRAPSAELRPDQTDQDNLPEYDVLDTIIELYIELDYSVKQLINETGFDPKVVEKIVRLVKINEYKRRQAAPGVRISQRAFGRDRRYPITSGFEDRSNPV